MHAAAAAGLGLTTHAMLRRPCGTDQNQNQVEREREKAQRKDASELQMYCGERLGHLVAVVDAFHGEL